MKKNKKKKNILAKETENKKIKRKPVKRYEKYQSKTVK